MVRYWYGVTAITNIPRDQVASIGIEKITENDFLSEESKFSESEALPARH